MLNKVNLIGYLGQDPEVRFTSSSVCVTNFAIACNESYIDSSGVKKIYTTWIRISVWGKEGEKCAKYLKKGSLVHVEGKITNRSYKDSEGEVRYSSGVTASKVLFLPSNKKDFEVNSPSYNMEEFNALNEASSYQHFDDEDIPF